MGETDVDRKKNIILIILVLIIIFCTGTFQEIENSQGLKSINLEPDWAEDRYIYKDDYSPLTFNKALYFVVVTLITVGYGEISPVSNLGNIAALCILAQTIIIVPQ